MIALNTKAMQIMAAEIWFNLLLFMALILAVSLHGLAASGQFPSEHRAASLRSAAGHAILFGSMVVAVLCLITGVIFAWRQVPWYAAIIGGGLVMLATPLLLRPFSDQFVNGRAALLAFCGASLLFALIMLIKF